jgi:hypothetical protein
MPSDKPQSENERALAEIEAAGRELAEAVALLGISTPATPRPPDEPPICSFCGVGSNNVPRMIGGNHSETGAAIFICSNCVVACERILGHIE